MKTVFTIIIPALGLCSHAFAQDPVVSEKPNVVVILADDLGVGDVSSYYSKSKLTTPNIDALAADGVRFSDAHANSAVCTPTRYGVLTGRYSWRTSLKRGVLMGYSKALIEPDRPTIASTLKSNGYSTACIGKWHLGMNFPRLKNKKGYDFTQPISGGPNAVGFDYYLGISASLDMPPYALIENNKFVNIPSERFKANPGPLGYIRGGAIAKGFKHVDYLPNLVSQTTNWIGQQTTKKKPFFLYMPLPSPHKPVLPNQQFKGKSGIGDYGDYVLETDWAVGQVIKKLKEGGVYDNTIIVFTSDNGSFAIPEKYKVVQTGHKSNGDLRGQKTDIYEGGHRVPFIVTWKKGFTSNRVSKQVICTTDIMPTVLGATATALPLNAAEDGFDFTPLLKGNALTGTVREATVHHSIAGMFAIRQGNWKLILGNGSGGRTKVAKSRAKVQLFNMDLDPAETTNLEAKHPEKVKQLTDLLQSYVDNGRSTPGAKLQNVGKTLIQAPAKKIALGHR